MKILYNKMQNWISLRPLYRRSNEHSLGFNSDSTHFWPFRHCKPTNWWQLRKYKISLTEMTPLRTAVLWCATVSCRNHSKCDIYIRPGQFHKNIYDVFSSYKHRTKFLNQKVCFIKLSKFTKFSLFVVNLRCIFRRRTWHFRLKFW